MALNYCGQSALQLALGIEPSIVFGLDVMDEHAFRRAVGLTIAFPPPVSMHDARVGKYWG